MGSSSVPVEILRLNVTELFDAQKKTQSLRQVSRGCKLEFVAEAGSSDLLEQGLELWSNYPPSESTKFKREEYYKYPSSYDPLTVWRASIPCTFRAGFFQFYLQSSTSKSQIGTFNVEPIVRINKRVIHKEEIVLQTMLCKSMGSVPDRWQQLIHSAAQSGYNAIHVTPIQVLGQSHSSYSIADQQTLSPSLYPSSSMSPAEQLDHLKHFLLQMEEQEGVFFMTDVVWNHTANNSPWLVEHPESGYNIENSPHLAPALELDEALLAFSRDILSNKYPHISPYIASEEQVDVILQEFRSSVWPSLRLWEYFVVNVDSAVAEFRAALLHQNDANDTSSEEYLFGNSVPADPIGTLASLGIKNRTPGKRHGVTVDLTVALSIFNVPRQQHLSVEEIDRRCRIYRSALDAVNYPLYKQLDKDLDTIVINLRHSIRRGQLSHNNPLVASYFTRIAKKGSTEATIALANNGWIWGGSALVNFASPESKSYFLREIIIWEDSVKLRYGDGYHDNPWLWEYMKSYTQSMASLFKALRIDNCHSTPLHVAQYMLDAARDVNPELYVIAELFTGDPRVDALFVANLGINALIRESMMAHDSWDLGRQIHRFGGSAVASVKWNDTQRVLRDDIDDRPESILIDCTHDNETPLQRRTAEDALPNAALTAFSCSAIGSCRGYDELVPQRIDVVTEQRLYSIPEPHAALLPAKTILNHLHRDMAVNGYREIHVHQQEEVITIQRHNDRTHEAVFLIAHTAFHRHVSPLSEHASIVTLPAKITQLVVAASLSVPPNQVVPHDEQEIRGLACNLTLSTCDCSTFCRITETSDNNTPVTRVQLTSFPPGSILVFRATLFPQQQEALQKLRQQLNDVTLTSTFEGVTLSDMNVLLYRCAEEERAASRPPPYDVPNYGTLTYSGIASVDHLLAVIRRYNDMSHPLFDNLRSGNWLPDYIVDRLANVEGLQKLVGWLRQVFGCLQQLPRYLIPKYFDMIICRLYTHAVNSCVSQMSAFVSRSNSEFVRQLALGSVQLSGIVPNTELITGRESFTLAAGLPHFSSGFMRCWGRDTFISLRGLFLVTGRHAEAKKLLLGFAACLRHGLIPNLLDSGRNPRYNARDATWWFLQAVQDYCSFVPNGLQLLQEHVQRRFPTDSQQEHAQHPAVESTLLQLIQEILQKHAQGIHFREWNAGPAIDSNMSHEGFNIDIHLDKNTGFIYGGNKHNCGTWMDKMGESERAKNKGIPATPRDGAAVEIIGLLKSTLRWIVSLQKDKTFPYEGVELADKSFLSYEEWNNTLQQSFEKHFWIPASPDEDAKYHTQTSMVHRREIYKDTVGSAHVWTDYQLRPNICIAMTVAPELFDRAHAQRCLEMIKEILLGPLGMKTLDPKDWNYRGDYDMRETDDYHTSKGFNYHQGPEWLWCVGYYLRAVCIFADGSTAQLSHKFSKILLRHKQLIAASPWRGLPELTNSNGRECLYSCPTQAWSIACMLDALYDISHRTLE